MTKPRIFIASSTEALKIAHAIQENLENDAFCKVWDQGVFELSGNSLENLLKSTNDFDFAIFVFQPDDILKIRDQTVKAVRDNVIFELGLFVSKLGKDRVFFLVPKKSEKTHLPTDLLGISPGHYIPPDDEKDLLAALGPFCNKVRRQTGSNFCKPSRRKQPISFRRFKSRKQESSTEKVGSPKNRWKEIERGVDIDDFGNYRISIAPTVFFEYRISKSFPGVRGMQWILNAKEALDRLEILLRHPTRFEESFGYGVTGDPIWWWRGGSCLPIEKLLGSMNLVA